MLITGQQTVGTVSTVLFTAPPGPSVTTLSSGTAGGAIVYIGAGSSVTSSNGVPLNAGGALTWATYRGSKGAQINGISASTGITVGWIISTGE